MDLFVLGACCEVAQSAGILLQRYAKNLGGGQDGAFVEFYCDKALSGDGYRISVDCNKISVFSNSAVGFNAAVGYLVRNQHRRIQSKTVTFNSDFRVTYFANHFYNYYHSAPVDEIFDYIESLALWGQTGVCLWFDMHHFTSFCDDSAKAMLQKMRAIFQKVKSLGMKCYLTFLANEYFAGAPKELLAENSTEGGRYFYKPAGFYFTELCPSKQDGEKLLLAVFEELLKQFVDIGIDGVTLWPYDQGGCTCKDCFPWGCNGFYKLAKKKAAVAGSVFPNIEITFSCWRFDHFTRDEWAGVMPLIKTDGDWIDRVMVDIGSSLPDGLAELGKPIVSFSEISMHRATPWGGFGANPFPNTLSRQVRECKSFCKGGALYSEGVFEDINKAVSLELMRDPDVDPKDVVNEYCAYHFGTQFADELTDIVMRLEETLGRGARLASGEFNDYPSGKFTKLHTYVFKKPDNIQQIAEDMLALDRRLPTELKENRRYKMIYIRAVGDNELLKNGGVPNETTDALYSQLIPIYHSEKAYYFVAPITRKSIMENRGEGV